MTGEHVERVQLDQILMRVQGTGHHRVFVLFCPMAGKEAPHDGDKGPGLCPHCHQVVALELMDKRHADYPAVNVRPWPPHVWGMHFIPSIDPSTA